MLHAFGDGYGLYLVSDTSGGGTREAHEMGIQRMIRAGAVPLNWGVLSAEWQLGERGDGTGAGPDRR